ncbi:hypothetical protein [Streptomyces gobiensis]|uniref:hypothetical protein n=1 Tax=Streptomyces gobiensis TaxID=2875706 RepID=UPI001E33E381|nr:hypothetical protein [Streptomyces gobiensis]UGY94278.1 hypothetical protein test1122_22805 [Streptomyces gobiensis]
MTARHCRPRIPDSGGVLAGIALATANLLDFGAQVYAAEASFADKVATATLLLRAFLPVQVSSMPTIRHRWTGVALRCCG